MVTKYSQKSVRFISSYKLEKQTSKDNKKFQKRAHGVYENIKMTVAYGYLAKC